MALFCVDETFWYLCGISRDVFRGYYLMKLEKLNESIIFSQLINAKLSSISDPSVLNKML